MSELAKAVRAEGVHAGTETLLAEDCYGAVTERVVTAEAGVVYVLAQFISEDGGEWIFNGSSGPHISDGNTRTDTMQTSRAKFVDKVPVKMKNVRVLNHLVVLSPDGKTMECEIKDSIANMNPPVSSVEVIR